MSRLFGWIERSVAWVAAAAGLAALALLAMRLLA